MSYYDASVVFYKLCMEKLTKGETFDKISTDEYWKKTSDTIHPARVRALLNQAIDVHDKILKNRGRFGRVHRCKNKPFRSKFISGVEHDSEEALDVFKNDNLCLGGQQKVICLSDSIFCF